MRLKFIKNFKYLKVVEMSVEEKQQLISLTTGKRYSYSLNRDEFCTFFHNKSIIPAGFWTAILTLRKMGYKVEIENMAEFLTKLDKADFSDWLEKQDLNFLPYDYQEKAIHLGLNYRQCRLLLDTSAGKSFIIYLYCLYLLKERLPKDKKILVVVPQTLLCTQLPNDFKDYSSSNELICDRIMGGGDLHENSNVVVGNIDSLVLKERGWFNQFGAVIIDEAHKIQNDSTQLVLNTLFQTGNCDYVLGLSGTFETKDNGSSKYDEYKAVTENAYLGSILMRLYYEDLVKLGTVTPCKVRSVKMTSNYNLAKDYYNHIDCKEEQGRFLFECNYIQGIPKYRKIIIGIAGNIELNQVLLFNTKLFLHKMADEMREHLKVKGIDKQVFCIDGDTSKKERARIIGIMNESSNCILFSMYSILSTGVSIKSLFGIHLVDSTVSVSRVRQSIGRVLRLHPSKEYALVMDYSVIFHKRHSEGWGGGRTNSYSNHLNERLFIYGKREFDVSHFKVDLDGRSEFMDEIPRALRKKVTKQKK